MNFIFYALAFLSKTYTKKQTPAHLHTQTNRHLHIQTHKHRLQVSNQLTQSLNHHKTITRIWQFNEILVWLTETITFHDYNRYSCYHCRYNYNHYVEYS